MKKKYIKAIILCLIIGYQASAQIVAGDTLHFMQYNLMYYTNDSGIDDCNSNTNNLNTKDAALKTIFQYTKPDVLCVCEIGTDMQYVNRILNNDLNVDGVDYYRNGLLTNYSGGHIANMLFYDSRKLTLAENYYITTSYRDINGYKLYYNSTDLAAGDTVFITFWVAHLKAGSGDYNENARLIQTQKLMSRLEAMGAPGNCVFSGDFNFTGSEQEAYQELVNYSNSLYKFYDPIDRPGHWNNNYNFRDLHTQSTHSRPSDCFVYGGLDDRFDIVLVSPYIYYGSQKVQVVPSTYHALGQDGEHFNKSINDPTNHSVPSEVADALYNSSDHLPVLVDFVLDAQTGIQNHEIPDFFMKVVNPIRDQLNLELQIPESDTYQFTVYAIDGRVLDVFECGLDAGTHKVHRNFDFPSGMYILKAVNKNHQFQIKKLVK